MILRRHQVPLLWICQVLFMMRVLGQIYVALYSPEWLPPMQEWYSGLMPYPILFPLQIFLIGLMTKVSYDNTRQKGYFYITQSKTKEILRTISLLYFFIMVIRYLVIMMLFPERRWFTGTIPIFFHWILALYIYLMTLNK